ncbi:MAG TPA: HAMP domain-containing sensor histidine kinase [Ktedonobacterales bacterium]|jgi:signal transduction histidine kinase
MHLSVPEPPYMPPGAQATGESPVDVSGPALAPSSTPGGERLEGTGYLLEAPTPEHATNYDNISPARGIPEETPGEQAITASPAETPPALETFLQAADGTLSDLLRLISHELKIPITVVQGQFQLVERQLDQLITQELVPLLAGQPDLEQKVESLRQRVLRGIHYSKQLGRQINDVLDLAHIQQGHWSLTLGRCNLVALLRETVEDLQQLWPNRKLLLSLPTTDQAPIYADEVRIRQVISNYVSNAHKYSPANQSIEIALHVDAGQVGIFVRDHGPGLSTEAQAQIWRRFYRVPGVQVQQGLEAGSGLGLTICRQLVEEHHGQVGVFSAPGEGSIFWFTLLLLRPSE